MWVIIFMQVTPWLLPIRFLDRANVTMKIYYNNNPHSIKEYVNDKSTSIQSKSDLYNALFPIYHLSKICGLLPVKFIQDKSGRYQGHLHIPSLVYSIFLLLILIVTKIWTLSINLYNAWINGQPKSWITQIIVCSDVMATMTLAVIFVLRAPFRWHQLQNIINRLVEVDEKLIANSSKKIYKFTVILISCVLLFENVILILNYYTWHLHLKMNNTKDSGIITYLPVYLLNVIVVIFNVQCALMTYNLGERFARLNRKLESVMMTDYNLWKDCNLEDFSRCSQFGTLVVPRVKISQLSRKTKTHSLITGNETCSTSKTIFQLMTVHTSLSDIGDLLNDTLGVPMLIVVLTCLLQLITTSYTFIVKFYSDPKKLFPAVQFLRGILLFVRLFIIVLPCHTASEESRKTAVLVSQLLSSNWKPEVRQQLETFSLQLLHRPLEFSAYGFFSIDRTLITSIVGTVTTYLVIAIQFHNENNTLDE